MKGARYWAVVEVRVATVVIAGSLSFAADGVLEAVGSLSSPEDGSAPEGSGLSFAGAEMMTVPVLVLDTTTPGTHTVEYVVTGHSRVTSTSTGTVIRPIEIPPCSKPLTRCPTTHHAVSPRLGAPDAIRATRSSQNHRDDRRCDRLANGGARIAAGDANYRFPPIRNRLKLLRGRCGDCVRVSRRPAIRREKT
jgi:hypothetical protein